MLGEHYRQARLDIAGIWELARSLSFDCSGVMGRQRAEESLNSFNAAPPLSDARLSSWLLGWFSVSRK